MPTLLGMNLSPVGCCCCCCLPGVLEESLLPLLPLASSTPAMATIRGILTGVLRGVARFEGVFLMLSAAVRFKGGFNRLELRERSPRPTEEEEETLTRPARKHWSFWHYKTAGMYIQRIPSPC